MVSAEDTSGFPSMAVVDGLMVGKQKKGKDGVK